MQELVEQIKNKVGRSSDFVYKFLLLDSANKKGLYVIYNECLCDGEIINDFILRELTRIKTTSFIKHPLSYLQQRLPNGNIQAIKGLDNILDKLLNGFTIILFDNEANTLAIETRAKLNRDVAEATSESSIQGPQDAFVEHYNTNVGLIRRRIKSSSLWIKEKEVGTLSKTKIGILYMENIVDKDLVNKVSQKLNKINIDGIIDSGYLRDYLEDNSNNFFPTILTTQRPDKASMALLEGKIVILVDTSPYVLILPTFFIDFFHTTDDYYQKPINITFIRLVRLLAFLIAILVPAYYIAVTTHNHDAIPLHLLINFTIQRENVPFPALIECLAMSITFEILRESDIRMPSGKGSAVSILGGLVLGDAAVSAGIISPIMIIVIAISAISGLLFSSIEMISAIRWWRFIMIFMATFLGIYGIFLAGVFLIIKLSSLNSYGKSYLAPFAPLIPSEQKDALLRLKNTKIRKRNPLLTKNKIRSR